MLFPSNYPFRTEMLIGDQSLPSTDIHATGVQRPFFRVSLVKICSLIWPEEILVHQVKSCASFGRHPSIGIAPNVNYELVVYRYH